MKDEDDDEIARSLEKAGLSPTMLEKLGLWKLPAYLSRVLRRIEKGDAMPDAVNQPTLAPTRKMNAVGMSGALATVVITLAAQWGIEISAEVAAAIVTLAAFAAGYFRRETV